jgi:hypothetical protein
VHPVSRHSPMGRLGVDGNGTLRRFLRPSNFILWRGSHKRRLDRAILGLHI